MTKISLTFADISADLALALISVANGGAIAKVSHEFSGVLTAGDADDDTPPVPGAVVAAFDSAGLPWDERIHAPSKGTNKDGTWRKKKNTPDALISAVETELRNRIGSAAPAPVVAPVMAPGVLPVAAPAPIAPMMTAPQPPAPVSPVPAGDFQPPQPPAPMAAPVAAPVAAAPAPVQHLPEAAPVGDFQALMGRIQRGMQTPAPNGGPLIPPEYLQSLVAEINSAWVAHGVQLTGLPSIMQHPQVIPYAVQILQRDGKYLE